MIIDMTMVYLTYLVSYQATIFLSTSLNSRISPVNNKDTRMAPRDWPK